MERETYTQRNLVKKRKRDCCQMELSHNHEKNLQMVIDASSCINCTSVKTKSIAEVAHYLFISMASLYALDSGNVFSEKSVSNNINAKVSAFNWVYALTNPMHTQKAKIEHMHLTLVTQIVNIFQLE